MRARSTGLILPLVITLLAVADGLIHLRLNFIFFQGRLWGTPSFRPPGASAGQGPPGGGPPAGFSPPQALPGVSLPNNELFTLNFLGYLLLAALLWVVLLRLGALASVVDILLILVAAAAFVGWFRVGKPNPDGLGYLSKGIEVALIVALVAHIGALLARPQRRRTRLSTA